MAKQAHTALTRRGFLKASGALSSGVLLAGLEKFDWLAPQAGPSDPFAQGKQLGVVATARNWTTVTSLLALADDIKA